MLLKWTIVLEGEAGPMAAVRPREALRVVLRSVARPIPLGIRKASSLSSSSITADELGFNGIDPKVSNRMALCPTAEDDLRRREPD